MKWSKLKSLVEEKFSLSLDSRISINSTSYGNCSCGHAWLTLDKEVIANFCTRAFWNRASGNFYRKDNRWVTDSDVPEHVSEKQKLSYGEVEYGELSRQDAYQACWEFVHTLKIDEAINSENPLIQSLATLDKRLGKRRLKEIDTSTLHPLAKKLLAIRLESEGLRITVCT
ncbi:SF0329 family protein [Microbulbifer sp. PSTR4-B]|uniref:SF0329 family protein n=1 Tax=Microbulbifer sp. PSTR4-B TaxID=3243396 RepID=UPI004039AC50